MPLIRLRRFSSVGPSIPRGRAKNLYEKKCGRERSMAWVPSSAARSSAVPLVHLRTRPSVEPSVPLVRADRGPCVGRDPLTGRRPEQASSAATKLWVRAPPVQGPGQLRQHPGQPGPGLDRRRCLLGSRGDDLLPDRCLDAGLGFLLGGLAVSSVLRWWTSPDLQRPIAGGLLTLGLVFLVLGPMLGGLFPQAVIELVPAPYITLGAASVGIGGLSFGRSPPATDRTLG